MSNRRIRWATGSEQAEQLNLSFVFVLLGFLLIALGVGRGHALHARVGSVSLRSLTLRAAARL